MERLLRTLRMALVRLAARDCPPDLVESMDLRHWADLPAHHPRQDDGCACG